MRMNQRLAQMEANHKGWTEKIWALHGRECTDAADQQCARTATEQFAMDGDPMTITAAAWKDHRQRQGFKAFSRVGKPKIDEEPLALPLRSPAPLSAPTTWFSVVPDDQKPMVEATTQLMALTVALHRLTDTLQNWLEIPQSLGAGYGEVQKSSKISLDSERSHQFMMEDQHG